MTEKNDSQTQQIPAFPFALPFTMPFAPPFGYDAWRKAMEDGLDRMRGACEEFGRVEAQGAVQARTAIDEGARLMRESVQYATTLSAEWRRASLEATRRTLEMMTPAHAAHAPGAAATPATPTR